MIIPFGLLPAAWGLKGKTRDIAEAEYYFKGERLDRELNKINYTGDEFMLAELKIDKQYGKISEEQYDRSVNHITRKDMEYELEEVYLDQKYGKITSEEAEYSINKIRYVGDELAIRNLEVDKKYGKVNDNQYAKQLATIKKEPWVQILTTEYDPKNPLTGSLDLDWNDEFIKSLEEAGYVGLNDHEVVDQWLTELCKNVATDTYGGVGTFDDDAATVLDNLKRNSDESGKGKATYT